jgi:hydroxyethylthiazole kinase-like uncharacterized protein yjeF
MIDVRRVAQLRAAEEAAFTKVAEGVLMQRAAHGLSVTIASLLREARGAVVGSSVALMVGSGNNGGDALWAGAMLARRGCRVDAFTVAHRWHAEGATALLRAGGHMHPWLPDAADLLAILSDADVVVDGLLGIGGAGGLRPDAESLVEVVSATDAFIVAVDVPSGVDADSGDVAGAAVDADVTVTFGAVKPGLLVAPGSMRCGSTVLIDIGLEFDGRADVRVLEAIDVAAWVAEPGADAYKYRRGVVGVSAGSVAYPGAALLAASAARHGNVGMTRFLDRGDANAATVLARFPEIVVDGTEPRNQPRVDAWACGPGFPGDHTDLNTVNAVLDAPVPVVLDAGALSILAESDHVQATVAERAAQALVTVITPHEGEFERIFPGLLDSAGGRLAAATLAASSLSAVVVLKGPGTLVASPDGSTFVDTEGTSDLGTAGSGDVLTGLIGAILAGAWAGGARTLAELHEAVAAAVWLHGRAGRIAALSGPVVAGGIAESLPAAVRFARYGEQEDRPT